MLALVVHHKTRRGFSVDQNYQVLEPLILRSRIPNWYKMVRYGYLLPVLGLVFPAWTSGLRDHEFVTFFFE